MEVGRFQFKVRRHDAAGADGVLIHMDPVRDAQRGDSPLSGLGPVTLRLVDDTRAALEPHFRVGAVVELALHVGE